ncbi:hypothetical protein RHSIM_Rhsim06G0027300 [Rhododendron simsii]|uniref:Uncharacterized protein n=1 Tax=Rhododendron simsii TaxID=118357 RepID=A0A834LHX1_RHOSS|nr:hypothetical protein RHSIM_Rhsim06G0027300 [Rhododendron simsii]
MQLGRRNSANYSFEIIIPMGRNAEDNKGNEQKIHHASNGCVDFRGRPADKRITGGWKSAPFIIVNEVAERLAAFSNGINMMPYLFTQMHLSLANAAAATSALAGFGIFTTIFGAFLADAYLGRFRTIMAFSFIYGVGMIMLTTSATIDALRPPPCTPQANTSNACTPSTHAQKAFLFVSMALISLGTGGIKPNIAIFGADQFDEDDEKEALQKYSFFSWFFFIINTGALLAITVLVGIREYKGWSWGFAAPTACMLSSILILVAGYWRYRFKKPLGSAFTRFFQVVVAAVRNHRSGVQEVGEGDRLYEVKGKESAILGARKIGHTAQYRFLDKAAVITNSTEAANANNRWWLCTVTQVEELKSFIRVLPIWATTIALPLSFGPFQTFFVSQAAIMDRKIGPTYVLPAGTVPVFGAVNAVLLVPLYEKLVVPVLRRYTGHRRGITSLQRMGVGLFISIFAMVSAALTEKRRRDDANPSAMSVFWLLPQFFLLGSAEVFTYVGQLEFFYDQASDGTRSLSNALFLTGIGLSAWINTALLKIIQAATGGEEMGWVRNDLNKSRLDNFYWVLATIDVVNFFAYLSVAMRFKGKDVDSTAAGADGWTTAEVVRDQEAESESDQVAESGTDSEEHVLLK